MKRLNYAGEGFEVSYFLLLKRSLKLDSLQQGRDLRSGLDTDLARADRASLPVLDCVYVCVHPSVFNAAFGYGFPCQPPFVMSICNKDVRVID